MSSYSWGQVDRGLYSNWKYSKPARAIMAHILALCPNQYGIYDPNPMGEIIDWWSGIFPREQVLEAFKELESGGVISSFRDQEILWVRKRFKRYIKAIKTEKHLQGVINALKDYPELDQEFRDLYGIQINDGVIQIESRLPISGIDKNRIDKSHTRKRVASSSAPQEPPTPAEQECLDFMKSELVRHKGYKHDQAKALGWLRKLEKEYPQVDKLKMLKSLDAWLDGSRKETKNWLMRMKNFCENAIKFDRDLKPADLFESTTPDFSGVQQL